MLKVTIVLLIQQCISTPYYRCLSMIITGDTGTIHIILFTVFLSGSNTNFSKIILVINIIT